MSVRCISMFALPCSISIRTAKISWYEGSAASLESVLVPHTSGDVVSGLSLTGQPGFRIFKAALTRIFGVATAFLLNIGLFGNRLADCEIESISVAQHMDLNPENRYGAAAFLFRNIGKVHAVAVQDVNAA